jgi:hypothetical protein
LDDQSEMAGVPIEIDLYSLPTDSATLAETDALFALATDPSNTTAAAVLTAVASAPGTTAGVAALKAYAATLPGTGTRVSVLQSLTVQANALNLLGKNLSLDTFKPGDTFVAFDNNGLPIPKIAVPGTTFVPYIDPLHVSGVVYGAEEARFDDIVKDYVDATNLVSGVNWLAAWGDTGPYIRTIDASGTYSDSVATHLYTYLLQPPGGVAAPKATKTGTTIAYRVNVPSILYQDRVLVDYYVEYRHNATQIDILPNAFAGSYYVEGEGLVKRVAGGVDLPYVFVIPNLKIQTALTLSFSATGDPAPLTFTGDALSDFTRFDPTKKVLFVQQVLEADDNYDLGSSGSGVDTSYRRIAYNLDTDGEYIWADPRLEAHSNIDFSDIGGPSSQNPEQPFTAGPIPATEGTYPPA